ncbi:glycosyltransferase family 2 protein [Francisella sp. 19X1-34]|uniref:glycosyltransferase family 2 protein n=1 Tax=Francisella sp. 19X1-34 TaxID=3087177 RepID=UPI002E37F813|nr:glycosyltransferase family 2 protein [Francisella sp. 19X1-34]MED7787527.1 glycosyltransferase family 2 protein [Francisella sp. 19X1-34]
MKKISVVTIVYNGQEGIERTIKSVISQTIRNDIEYIIVDGASKDNTLNIIKKYEDYIDKFVSEPDHGIYDAMNKGISLASGEWISFINADDIYAQNDVLAKAIAEAENAGVIYGKTKFMSESGEFLYEDSPEKIETIFDRMPFGHPSTLTKADLLKELKFNTAFRITADFDFFLKAYLSGAKFIYADITISEFRLGGVSSAAISSTTVETIYSILSNTSVEVTKKSLFYKNLSFSTKLEELKELNERLVSENEKLETINSSVNELNTKIQKFYTSKVYNSLRFVSSLIFKIRKRVG